MLVRDLITLLETLPQDDVVDMCDFETEESAREITFKDPDAVRELTRPKTVYVQAYTGLSVLYLVSTDVTETYRTEQSKIRLPRATNWSPPGWHDADKRE